VYLLYTLPSDSCLHTTNTQSYSTRAAAANVLPFFSANDGLPTISSTSKSSKSSKSNNSSDAYKSGGSSGKSTALSTTAKGAHIAAPVPFTPAYMEAGHGSSSVYEDARSSRSSSSGATAVYDSVQRRRSMSNVNTSSSTVATTTAAGGIGGVSNSR
jgi:hypothetical protein